MTINNLQQLQDLKIKYPITFSKVIEYKKDMSLFKYLEGFDIVTRNKRDINYLNCGLAFDCETTTLNIHELSFVYIWQFAIGDYVFLCSDILLFKNLILNITNTIHKLYKKNTKIICYDCNLSFEYAFFKNIIGDMITDSFASAKRRILSITLCDCVIIKECLGVWGYSLENISNLWTKTKKLVGDLDYSIIRTPKHLNLNVKALCYCINDVKILSELCIIAHETYTKNGKKIPLTQTGIVRNELKDSYTRFEKIDTIKYNSFCYTDSRLYNIHRQYLYSGGLTHSNMQFVNTICKNVTCVDLTSAYPHAMLNDFPCGKIIHTNDYKKALKYKHWCMCITFNNICAKTSHTLISKHKICETVYKNIETGKTYKNSMVENGIFDNGRLFCADNVTLWVNEIDYENIKALYSIKSINILKCYYFTDSKKIDTHIKNLMLKYYLLKQDLKDKGLSKTKEYLIAKQKVNSLYGMIVTQIYDKILQYNHDKKDFTENTIDFEKASEKTLFNCYVGYYITSYTRKRLVDVIAKYPNDVIQYDTDSLYIIVNDGIQKYIDDINKKVLEQNKQNLNANEKLAYDLGLWDNDGYYKLYRGYGAKRYVGIKDKKINHGDKQIKITWAGGVERDILYNYRLNNLIRIHNNLNKISIFEYMERFNILNEMSTKLNVKYIDSEKTIKVNNEAITILSCAYLYKASFKSALSSQFRQLFEKSHDLRDKYIFNKGV